MKRSSSCPDAFTRPLMRGAGAALLSLAALAPAHARVDSIAYYMPAVGIYLTLLVDWDQDAGRARVVTSGGVRTGTFTGDDQQRVLTLSEPYSAYTFWFDSCDQQASARYDTSVYIFRPRSGTPLKGETEYSDITTLTILDGCDEGQVITYGSLDEPGSPVANLSMDKRDGVGDLKPGRRWAGVREAPYAVGSGLPAGAEDVGEMLPGRLFRFQSTGLTVPAKVSGDGWLKLSMPGFVRGYTRLTKDPVTGHEVWLHGDFVDGKLQWVLEQDMVRVDDAATFGSTAEVTRSWRSALDFYELTDYRFYSDATGHRVSTPLEGGDSSYAPLTWSLSGDLVIDRSNGAGKTVRTWTPLARHGNRQWVMEREARDFGTGVLEPYIAPRVMYYTDMGPAVPPTKRLQQRTVEPAAAPRPGPAQRPTAKQVIPR